MLQCACSVIDHRRRQNVVWTKRGTRGAAKCVSDFPNAFWPYLYSITERTQGNIEFIVIYDKKHHIVDGDVVYVYEPMKMRV